MIIDILQQFSRSGSNFAQEEGTYSVGNVIDLSDGNGRQDHWLPFDKGSLHINVETPADGGATGTGTAAFQLVSDIGTPLNTNGTQIVHCKTRPLVASDLKAGIHIVAPLPVRGYERYLGLQVVQDEEGEDDLVCSAYLSTEPGTTWYAYADGSN